MNTEIEFRFFNKIDNEWLNVYDFAITGAGELIYNHDHYEWTSYLSDHKYDIIIQRYTGLKDKNGVEIFEGDVLEIWDGRKLPVKFGQYFTGFEKRDSHNGWYLESEKAISDIALDERYTVDEYGVTVIDNIFNVPYQVKRN